MMGKITLSALLITITIFSAIIGLSLLMENSRLEDIKKGFSEVDVLWNDARFFSEYLNTGLSKEQCDFLFEENLNIGDRVYNEGLKIEKYENSNKLTDALLIEKKRYALLDLQFLKNTLKLKEMCNSSFSTVVYFYSQYNKTSDQKVEDMLLWDFKQRCGPKTIYITFPADIGLSSIDMIKKAYNVTAIPSVVIDEKTVLTGLTPLEELNSYAHCW